MLGNMKDFKGQNFYIYSICNEIGVEIFNIYDNVLNFVVYLFKIVNLIFYIGYQRGNRKICVI